MGKSSNDRKVCVTGGEGYIGSWLVKKLLEKGTDHATRRVRTLDDVSKLSLSTMQLQYKSTTKAAIAWGKSIAESSLKSGTYSLEADLHRFCAWFISFER
ncbi:hypothetical protein M0R45_034192 [Rubus argutus]|uniref:NAD-dependent epimerase/dehydratase domain-containing protein n=1 Tax=Rubus argutus TaxID=59490 RepID=A0AAW1VTS1_RUBAR